MGILLLRGGAVLEIHGIERVDHHGIVAGIIHDLDLIRTIDSCVGVDKDEKVTTGEAMAAMIINGLGFTDRPLSLVPQFFENCPLDLLFRPGVCADDFNRFKLGRALDKAFNFGVTRLFSVVASSACRQEGVVQNGLHLDTTSFSLSGEYIPDLDEHAVNITHGHSKDHRPDLKQVVLEMMVSSDGGVPTFIKAWPGNASDSKIFQKRACALLDGLKNGDELGMLYADSKLYSEKNAENLGAIDFATRIPESNRLARDTISQALAVSTSQWESPTPERRMLAIDVEHFGMAQRWIVVQSETSKNRAKKTVSRRVAKEEAELKKALYHLQAQRFSCQDDATESLNKI